MGKQVKYTINQTQLGTKLWGNFCSGLPERELAVWLWVEHAQQEQEGVHRGLMKSPTLEGFFIFV
jgi:hypothetical protein